MWAGQQALPVALQASGRCGPVAKGKSRCHRVLQSAAVIGSPSPVPPPLPALAESIDYGLDANQEDEGEDVVELEVGAPRSTFLTSILLSCPVACVGPGWRWEEHAQPRHPSL